MCANYRHMTTWRGGWAYDGREWGFPVQHTWEVKTAVARGAGLVEPCRWRNGINNVSRNNRNLGGLR
jgi:hypothetical protein